MNIQQPLQSMNNFKFLNRMFLSLDSLLFFPCRCEWFDGAKWHVGQPMLRSASALTLTMAENFYPVANFRLQTFLDQKRHDRLNLVQDLSITNNNLIQDVQGNSFDIFLLPESQDNQLERYSRLLNDCIRIVNAGKI